MDKEMTNAIQLSIISVVGSSSIMTVLLSCPFLFISLTITGIVKILMVYFKFEQGKKIITALSVGLSIIAVLFLAMAREPYAITVMFLLLFIKGGLLYKQAKAGQ